MHTTQRLKTLMAVLTCEYGEVQCKGNLLEACLIYSVNKNVFPIISCMEYVGQAYFIDHHYAEEYFITSCWRGLTSDQKDIISWCFLVRINCPFAS
jgi:hypothetical protein